MRILDTTLRDGEQTPGLSLNPEKKLLIARKLDEIGVSVIEAGSACASDGEKEAIRRICHAGLSAEISSFSRTVPGDVKAALDAGVSRVSLVVPTSDLHMEKKLKTTKQKLIARMAECIRLSVDAGAAVEILAEDGSRTPAAQLAEFFNAARDAGADCSCVCDTVGVLNPVRTKELMGGLKRSVAGRIAFHGHNDLGLATANSLAAFEAGVDELHCTVNGLGERCGNASLEEVAAGLHLFYGEKSILLEKAYELSQLVETLSGIKTSPLKPLVGKNAFSHESGIHVDGILKCAQTYEGVQPGLFGRTRSISAGKHSGGASVALKLADLGLTADDGQRAEILARVKVLGDAGKEVTDADIYAIALDVLGTPKQNRIVLDELLAVTGNKVTPMASVRMRVGGESVVMAGTGDGPVDAAVNAIERALGGTGVKLVEYEVGAVTGGADALVGVKVKMKKGDRYASASAAGPDIVLASVEAVLKSINVLL